MLILSLTHLIGDPSLLETLCSSVTNQPAAKRQLSTSSTSPDLPWPYLTFKPVLPALLNIPSGQRLFVPSPASRNRQRLPSSIMANRSPSYCFWLPSAKTPLSKYCHVPLVDLSAYFHLKEAYPDHYADQRDVASMKWSDLQVKMRRQWTLENAGEEVLTEVPLRPDDEVLRKVFHVFKYMFEDDMNDGLVTIRWTGTDVQPTVKGRTVTRYSQNQPTGADVVVSRPSTTRKGFYIGDAALDIVSTVLHELCHAWLFVNICQCRAYGPIGDRLGLRYHGNTFIKLLHLVQREVNAVFGGRLRFDLDL